MNIKKIAFIVPVFNEAARIKKSLKELKVFFEDFCYDYNLIFVDDGSTDGTVSIVNGYIKENNLFSFQIIKLDSNQGKGAAVRFGMLNAPSDADLYFFMDADLSTPLREIHNFIECYKKNKTDIVIGSRSLPGSKVIKRQNFLRETMGKTFNKILKLITGIKFVDTQCGFKMFTPSAKEKIFPTLKVKRFAFDAEIVFLAQKYGISITDLPVEWVNDDASKVRIVADSLIMLKDVLRIRYSWLARKYR